MSGIGDTIAGNKIWSNGSIPFFISACIMVLMPVYHWFLPPFIIFWMLYFISKIRSLPIEIRGMDSDHKTLTILFILFFIWQVAGMLYSDNLKEGWRNLELRVSLLLFPLVLLSPGDMIRKRVHILLKVFAVSTFSFLFFCYIYDFYRSLSIQDGSLIFNPFLPEYTWLNYFSALEFAIFQHTSYLSMFTLLSFYIALENIFGISGIKKYQYLWLIISVILMMSIYFLSSRAGILAAIITLPVYLFLKFRTMGKLRYFWISMLLMTVIFVPIVLTNPRVNNYQAWKEKNRVSSSSVSNDRMIIWNSAKTILGQNLILGTGTGDIQDELNKEFRRTGNIRLAEVNTNTHNQFLEILIEHGFIGLIMFLSMILMMFYIAYQRTNILYLIFLLLVIISFLFETMLNRLAGVAFFSLFSFLLIIIEGRNSHNLSSDK